jgi:four helix bundle protein
METGSPPRFDHERLEVYRLSVDFAAWAFGLAGRLSGPHRSIREQFLRAAQSVPLNIAEGNGKRPGADRSRFLQIARGSALECAAALDVIGACCAVPADVVLQGRDELFRVVSMLVKMIQANDAVREEEGVYDAER